MKRNTKDKGGLCGIAKAPLYPVKTSPNPPAQAAASGLWKMIVFVLLLIYKYVRGLASADF